MTTAIEQLPPQEFEDRENLAWLNEKLEGLGAEERIEWALHYLPGNHVLTSSFGIQGALMLHLVTRIAPDIPVVLVDTGYLFPETYRFVDELTDRLQLNLHIYRAPLSPNWQESRYGKLWEQGLAGIEHLQPHQQGRAAQARAEGARRRHLAGLRRDQADTRAALPVVCIQDGRFKIHPVIDWTNRDVYRYLRRHQLPYHPLWEQGYATACAVTSASVMRTARRTSAVSARSPS